MEIFTFIFNNSLSVLCSHFGDDVNSELLIAYIIASVFIRKPHLLLAFFMGCLLFEWSFFDSFSEAQLYLLGFLIYSYVIPCNVFRVRTKVACAIMCFLCLLFAYDAAFFGVNGFYEEHKTFVYNNIEHFFICSHCLIICSLINLKRIRDDLRGLVDSVCNMSRNSVYFVVM